MKIVSWNIAGGRKMKSEQMFDYEEENLDYFAEQILSIDADVVCLQETHTNAERSVAKDLAKILKMDNVIDSPTSPSHVDKNFQLGTAIISRLPFNETKVYQYPDPSFELYFSDGKKAITHHKNLQEVKIEDFYLANTQMLPIKLFGYEYDRGKGFDFAKEIEKTLTVLEQPIIFCGDFNFDNPSKVYPDLFNKLGLKEALPNKVTRPSPQGKKTPDHIFYSPKFHLIKSGVVKTLTDHYLCYAELVF